MTQASSDSLLEPDTRWLLVPGYDGTHCIPLGDLKPHSCAADCWCGPADVSKDEDPTWSHNSMDRREHTIEQGIFQ